MCRRLAYPPPTPRPPGPGNLVSTTLPHPLCRGHEHESLLLQGLAHYENVHEKLGEVVHANTPWRSLVEPPEPPVAPVAPPGGGEGGTAGGGRAKRDGPLLSAAAQATSKAAKEAAAKETAAKPVEVPVRASRAPRPPKAKAAEEPESAPEAKAVKKDKGGGGPPSRLTTSAATHLYEELATLRAGTPRPPAPPPPPRPRVLVAS